MQKMPLSKLQELANMLYEEPNVGLRASMSAWIDATNTNHENTSFSSISAMAQQSGIKDKILAWVDKVLNPDKPFVYVPDIPAQMEENTVEHLPKEIEFEIPLPEVIKEEKPKASKKIKPSSTDKS